MPTSTLEQHIWYHVVSGVEPVVMQVLVFHEPPRLLTRVPSARCHVQLAMRKVLVAQVDHDPHEIVALHAVHGGRPRKSQRELSPQNTDRQVAVLRLDGEVDERQGERVLANGGGVLQLHDHGAGAAFIFEHRSQVALDQACRAV